MILTVVMVFAAGWGCTFHSTWQRQKEDMEGLAATRLSAPPVEGYHDYPGAVHVHSDLSRDSRGSIDEIAEAARKVGTAFVIMTDHHNPRIYSQGFEGWMDGVLILRGSEIIRGCYARTADTCNSLLVLGLEDYFDPDGLSMHEVVDEVRRRGGLAFAAHPKGFTAWDSPGVAGLEIYDILDDAIEERWRFPRYFFDVLYSFRTYPEQVFLSILDRPDKNLERWDTLNAQRRWVALAGNDAHQNIRILGRLIDPYELSFNFVRTHILAQNLTETEVLAALARGHAYVAFDILSDATGFGFWAEGDKILGLQGDEVLFRPDLRLVIQTPVVGLIELVRNGTVIRRATALRLIAPLEEPGVYRVQVALKIDGRWRPWIFSNPIYVREIK